MYPECIKNLIDEFKRLPGIGDRTSERLALFLSRNGKEKALNLAHAVQRMAETIQCCSICFNTSDMNPCPICSSAERNKEKILIVEGPGDLIAFENAGWDGVYHVLQGAIDPVEGVLPEHLTLNALVERIRTQDVAELIIATNPDFEGDGTALLLAKELTDKDIKVSRIARGVATGARIEYANRAMLADALSGRTPLKR